MDNQLSQPSLYVTRTVAYLRQAFIVMACIFLQACAHSNLINTADAFNDEQRYELAAQFYQQALNLRPNNKTTLEKLRLSEATFNQWLSQLENSAAIAYDNELDGKALLLYGKLSTHSNDPVIHARYDELLGSLNDYAQLYVKVNYDADVFGNDLALGIDNFTPIVDSANLISSPLDNNNEDEIDFTFQQGEFSFNEKETYESGSYISGYVIIDNPEYLTLQHNLPNSRFRIRESRYDTQRYRDIVQGFEHELVHLERNQHSENESGHANSALQDTRARLNRARSKLSHYHRELDERRRRLDHDLIRMSYLPLTVQQDIYSEHVYSVIESTAKLDGQLFISKGNIVSEHNLTALSVDTYHDAQPILNLPQDPLLHQTNTQLIASLNQEARNQARRLMQDMAFNYRSTLLNNANHSMSENARMEGWVLYGLSGKNGVSGSLAQQITQQLQNEIGVGGELSINSLLHPQ